MGNFPFHRQVETKAVSSVYGKIELLLLAYPGMRSAVTTELVLERFGSVFRAFGDRVTFVVMGHFGDLKLVADQVRASFEEAMQRCSIDPHYQLILCHTPLAADAADSHHSEFVQDPFVVLGSDGGAVVLLEPLRQHKQGNHDLAGQLSASAGFLMRSCGLQIEGGNILVGDDYALVGGNLYHRNLPTAAAMAPDAPRAWVEATLKRLLGLRFMVWVELPEVLDLGTFHSTGDEQRQPFFHIDLMLRLAGRSNTGKEIVLLATVCTECIEDLQPADEPLIARINAALDVVERRLEGKDHHVPGPTFDVLRMEIGGKMTGEADDRRFVPYSYLNAHLESYRGVRRAYLPSFPGMEDLQARAEELLQRIGYRYIRFISNAFEHYALHNGSLHCISKVLARSPE